MTSLPAMINKKTHNARLYLARALSRTDSGVEEACKYYNEVLVMAPEVSTGYLLSVSSPSSTSLASPSFSPLSIPSLPLYPLSPSLSSLSVSLDYCLIRCREDYLSSLPAALMSSYHFLSKNTYQRHHWSMNASRFVPHCITN